MPAASLTIVPVYAAVLALLYIALTFNVIRNRYRLKISLGNGDNQLFNRAIRGHGNFSEYAPLSLLLLAFAEIGGSGAAVIHTGAGLLLMGRFLHAYALAMTESNMFARRNGMILTIASIVVGAIACLTTFLGT